MLPHALIGLLLIRNKYANYKLRFHLHEEYVYEEYVNEVETLMEMLNAVQ